MQFILLLFNFPFARQELKYDLNQCSAPGSPKDDKMGLNK